MNGQGSSKATITGTALLCSVGLSSQQVAAAVRAGVSRYEDSPFMDRRFQPFRLATVPQTALPALSEELQRCGHTGRKRRLLQLAGRALVDVAAQCTVQGITLAQLPLVLALPETQAAAQPESSDSAGPVEAQARPLDEGFLDGLAELLGEEGLASFDLEQSSVYPLGRAAGTSALAAALTLLEERPAVLLGGVDSYFDLATLGRLQNEERILGDGVMDGFIPGEGAAFLLLRRGQEDSVAPAALAQVLSVGLGEEAGHRYSEEPYRGEGLAAAFTELFANCPEAPSVGVVWAGFNGEGFWAKEWGVARLRNAPHFEQDAAMHHPADCYGDLGAATVPMLMALASHHGRTGGRSSGRNRLPVAQGDRSSLVFASSDRELRGAVLLAHPSSAKTAHPAPASATRPRPSVQHTG